MKLLGILMLAICSFFAPNKSNSNSIARRHNADTLALAKDSLKLDSLIKKTPFKLNNNAFSGPGWAFLTQEVQKAHIVLIGEQHGEAEIPIFTTQLAFAFKPKALVTEIDPYTAIELKKVSLNPSGYSAYFKQNPYAFAFYSWQTEMELVRQMQLKQVDIWGLNEINFLSLGRFFTMLSAAAQSPANKKLALTIGQNYAEHDRPIFADVNKYNDFIAYKIKPPFVDSLIYQFRNENSLCKKMLNDLKLSLPVFANTSYQQRINIMKKDLMSYLAPYIGPDSISLPKLLFKFGANHVTRTNDLTTNFEVGNLADNLAEAANKKSLHILILGKKGTVNTMAPVNNSVAIQPYDLLTDGDLAAFKSFINPLKGDDWAVYDLRPIRRALILGKLHVANETLHDYVKGFDLLVVFAQVNGNKFIE